MSQKGGVNKVVGIPNKGNECVLNSAINCILNSDGLCSSILRKYESGTDVEELCKKCQTLEGIPDTGSQIELYVILYYSLPNSTLRKRALDNIRTLIHQKHGGGMMSPRWILGSFPYVQADIFNYEEIQNKVDACDEDDVFIELNLSSHVSDRTKMTTNQRQDLDNFLECLMIITPKCYICTDFIAEAWSEGQTVPSHVVYYNLIENKMSDNEDVYMYPFINMRFYREYLPIELGSGHYVNFRTLDAENKRIRHCPKVLHFQKVSRELLHPLSLVGHGRSLADSFIGHTLMTATARLRFLVAYIQKNERKLASFYMREKHRKYGAKLNDTLSFYEKMYRNPKRISHKERKAMYDKLSKRNYNFFEEMVRIEDNTSWKLDPLIHDLL